MKNHIVDATIGAETLLAMNTALGNLNTEITAFAVHMNEAQRKHNQKIGTRNETFAREMLEFARQHTNLSPAGIDLTALQRDLVARDQLTPILFRLKALTRQVEDTHIAMGVDLFNGARALYKGVKPIALINGVQDIITHIGLRFASQGRKKTTPPPTSIDSSEL